MALTPQARETFTRLFGVEPQPHPTDPELFDILQNGIFDEAFSAGVLTDVERELLTITALTAMQTLPQLRAHVGAALNIGASPLQLRETIYQCAPYIGFPKTLNAIDIANKVLRSAASPCPWRVPAPLTPSTPVPGSRPEPPSRPRCTATRSRRSSPPCPSPSMSSCPTC